MGKKTPKAPSAAKQYQAQSAADKDTAWYNAQLENMDEYTPYGSLTYQNLGTKEAPKWSATTTLSPKQQQLLDSGLDQDIALNALGDAQLGRIEQSVNTPFSFGGLKNQLPSEADIMQQQLRGEEALMSRINPQFMQDEEALRTRLINQGIGQGSEAYNREMNAFNQSKNDARMQAILGGQQYGSSAQNDALNRRLQEINEYTTQRNAPLNEFSAFTSGTQIQNPSFSYGGNEGIGNFNMAQALRDEYSNKVAAGASKKAGASSIGSILGAAGGFMIGGPAGVQMGASLGGSAGSLFA